ncbi:MAG: siroheme synthase CysG [Methylorubrum extorquens]|jgi:uroporphyrin-III C-methyltransferase/precorrin-2 dehydrogenase/sirohydrochlorin ferrochelatase|uniref:Siroheme synthase n=1 Tax=Methylorubrum extorquens (strain DSM 6343 / CIP 106787 / DM4) TaxID=661410 RepID=C7CCR6_METED|nr:siroheme synthase CysG [Methylorubrum extorquens]CAX25646.1 Siroheme synthase [Methylorubrum extorquens DM4]
MSTPRQPRETRAGLEPLAVLPVFVPLQDKRAVLAGSNGGAPWKVKLLAAAGAQVDVYAEEPSEELRGVPAEIAAGSVTLHERRWTPADLQGAAFAIGAMEDEDDCVAFVAAARAAGAIVNAVDRPHLCDVKFGAIVNRSPLVVGISTEGAAPVFGQTVRARIEAMLPRGFKHWVAAARDWREAVSARFHGFSERRGFWERFTDRAFAEPDRTPTDADLADLMGQAEALPLGGAVTLVGAGPGDAELLTLKALRALRNADVILYDDLVAPEILDYARREARTMLVGKTGHGPSCRQDDINALMVSLAKSGKQVVRLKSGDPLVFGRAGEEIEACEAAGIPCTIVPGVSAAQGAAAALGVSLTHRDAARRLQFVTGHDRRGALPEDLNWSALADRSVTTVVYMPKRTLRVLLERAVAEGLAPETPALVVFNATRAKQATVAGTAAGLADRVEASGLEGPALLMVGEALRQHNARSADRDVEIRAEAS